MLPASPTSCCCRQVGFHPNTQAPKECSSDSNNNQPCAVCAQVCGCSTAPKPYREGKCYLESMNSRLLVHPSAPSTASRPVLAQSCGQKDSAAGTCKAMGTISRGCSLGVPRVCIALQRWGAPKAATAEDPYGL